MTETFENLEIRKARIADLDVVLSILVEVARWLVSRRNEGWTPGSFSRQRIAVRIERNEMYLAELAGQAVGTWVLQWSDEETWGDVPHDAGYVHGLAIRREFAGRGLGLELLRQAENMVAASGKKYLRLDCIAGNPALNEYYERAGFGYKGRVPVRGLEVSMYEKEAGALGAG